ncbi:MAG TPA: serine protease [Kofleriaceae bacterium]|nr:serine protease [Kofleriaceae bacterium]
MGEPREPSAQLADMLADLYYRDADIQRIVVASGLKPAYIEWDARPVNTWTSVVREATNRGVLERVLDTALLEYPDHPGLLAAKAGALRRIPGTPALDWVEPSPETFEKIIGSNDLLPFWFLERAHELGRAVGLVKLADGSAGTGFLVGVNLVLTNNHVAPSAAAMDGASFVLNYQETKRGADAKTYTVAFDAANGFATHLEHDWSLVRLADAPGAEWGTVEVEPREASVGSAVYIIQHPGGGPKHIALGDNRVTYAGKGVVQYLTDTLPGSSGSPVFDRTLRLVALHHSGGHLREPGTKKLQFRNEGIAISEVHAGLVASKLWP